MDGLPRKEGKTGLKWYNIAYRLNRYIEHSIQKQQNTHSSQVNMEHLPGLNVRPRNKSL